MRKEQVKVGFVLQGIKTEQFAVIEENFKSSKETGFNTQLQFKLDQHHKLIGVFLGFELVQSKKTFIKIEISCHFKIQDESWNHFLQEKKSMLIVPKVFLTHIAMITVSSARGVLFAKTEGTPFSRFIVPLINVAEMITEDASFSINQDRD